MRLFDPKFRDNKLHYFLQCMLVTLVIFIILMGLRAIANVAIIAALGASSFIAFTMPHINASRPRYLLGGYAVGIAIGAVFSLLAHWPFLREISHLEYSYPLFCAAMAVGLSVFIMVIFDVEHPPAAGVALGLALGPFEPRVITVVAMGIFCLSTVKHLIKPVLIDLL